MKGRAQRTIAHETSLEGTGLHTGETTRVRFAPAPAGHGVRFRRTDVDGASEITASLDNVVSSDRGTSLGSGERPFIPIEKRR